MKNTQFPRIRNLARSQFPQHAAASNISDDKANADSTIVNITNRQYVERRGKYTNGLKDNLDPRDRQFIIPFDAVFSLTIFSAENTSLIDSQQYSKLKLQIQNYVAELCENINSISFQLLNEGKLTDNQVKAFASKNILANIQSVLTDIRQKFNQASLTNTQQNQDLMRQLTYSIDEQLREVLSQLANNYPQAPPTGVTPRMKRALTDINRSQEQKNDFIAINNFNITQYIPNRFNQKDSQSYTGFIMEVIDKAIRIAGETMQEYDETVMQKFHHFNQTLFSLSSKKNIEEMYIKIGGGYTQKQLITKIFSNQFKTIPQKKKDGQEQIQNAIQELIQNFKKDHKEKYGIGRKIPSHVKNFSAANLRQIDFHVSSSSVLRIMTKWAQNLEEIFENPDFRVMQRVQQFKTIENQFKKLAQNQKKQIVQKLRTSYEQIKSELQILKDKNTLFKSYFLSTSQPPTAYLKRFTEVRAASSQINATLIEFTRKYLCLLIHHLIKAGQIIQKKYDKNQSCSEDIHINLVIFRVGDLLRSKFQCNERQFINIMNNLLQLDQSKEMQGKFKIVRIKNKLNQRDSNVLINYLFMGKVQCELQLSVQSMAPKDKNFYSFCHFLYELTRGKFGVLTQCATIVCQHDPIINASIDAYYRPKHYESIIYGKQFTHSVHKKNSTIFLCWKCHQLITKENILLFAQSQTACNQCICKEQEVEQKFQKLAHKNMKTFLVDSFKNQKIKRIRDYSQVQSGNYVLSLNNKIKKDIGKIYFVWEQKKQLKLFFIQINRDGLGDLHYVEPDWSKIDYFAINRFKAQKSIFSELTFIIDQEYLPSAIKHFKLSNFFKMKKLNSFQSGFRKFRQEKLLVKSIKSRCEIIQIQKDYEKLQALNKITKAFGQNKGLKFPYKQQNALDYSHINKISFGQIYLTQPPIFLSYINGIKEIVIRGNYFVSISFSKIITLQRLAIEDNLVEQVNIQGCKILKQLTIKKTKLVKIDISYNEDLLNCYIIDNQLEVIEFGQKYKLQKLSLQKNKLTKIDLSICPNLQILNVCCNKLSQINLNQNINIHTLKLQENQLKTIELVSNTKLIDLQLNKNKLNYVNLNFCQQIKFVYINQNELPQIDVSKNIKMTKLSLDKNKITEIDVSNNIHLYSLSLDSNKLSNINISKNIQLERLYLNDNNLVAIDLSQNKIFDLNLDKNNFTEIDLSPLKSIQFLSMGGNKLKKIDLTKYKNFNRLNLQNNQLTEISLNSDSLHDLSLAGNELTSISTWFSPLHSQKSFTNQRVESCEITLIYTKYCGQQKKYRQSANSLVQRYKNDQTCKFTFKIQERERFEY